MTSTLSGDLILVCYDDITYVDICHCGCDCKYQYQNTKSSRPQWIQIFFCFDINGAKEPHTHIMYKWQEREGSVHAIFKILDWTIWYNLRPAACIHNLDGIFDTKDI